MCLRNQIALDLLHMNLKEFKTIVDGLEGTESITLHGMGEPLIYPHLMEVIGYCKSKNIKTRFTTNGILLREKASALVDAALDIIHLSVENPQQKGFLSDILELKRIRDQREVSTPRLVLQPILFHETSNNGNSKTVDTVYELIKWGGEHGIDMVNIARVDLRTDASMIRPNLDEEKQVGMELSKLRKKYPHMRIDFLQDQVYTGLKGFLYKYLKHFVRLDSWCYRFQDYTYIDVNGNVHPCPIDSGQIMGNVFEQSLHEIWTGDRYNYLRKHQEEFDFCRRCDFLKLKQVSPV